MGNKDSKMKKDRHSSKVASIGMKMNGGDARVRGSPRQQRANRLFSEHFSDSSSDSEDSNNSICDPFYATINYHDYKYPFENLVLEGGGNKGLAYCGAIKVFEEAGIWKNVRRLAGASAGAMTATLLAVGYRADEIELFLSQDLKKMFLDHSCGYFSLVPNMIKYYGWNPGNRLLFWFGEKMHEKTEDKDITFQQLYKRFGKELCIVVTNVNRMDTEYCHVKTTPNLPIRQACRMSMAIPAMFQSVKITNAGNTDVYVDGGLLCNYPIHCFDGWWLSLETKDCYLRKLQPLDEISKFWDKSERFGSFNEKTIGMLLYSGGEHEIMKERLEKRSDEIEPPVKVPDTKLARKRNAALQKQKKISRKHAKACSSMSRFLKVLADSNLDQNDTISKDELELAFQDKDDSFTENDARILFGKEFGKEFTIQNVFEALDQNNDGEVTFQELISFSERRGIDLTTHFLGYGRREVNNLRHFLVTVQDAMLLNLKRVFVDQRDLERTIGIDTGYVDTTDFEMEPDDKKFLTEQGARAARSFLRSYVKEKHPPLKKEASSDNSFATKLDIEKHNGKGASSDVLKSSVNETIEKVSEIPERNSRQILPPIKPESTIK